MRNIMIVGLVALIAIFGISFAQEQEEKKDGSLLFLPTQMDWLVVSMNARFRMEELDKKGFHLSFYQGDDPETLSVIVNYLPDVHREHMNMAIDHAKKMARIYAKSRKWDSWLKIEEELTMLKPAK